MASVIWIDSDTDDGDDFIEFVEAPTPRKHPARGPLAGPSKIFNTPTRTHKKRHRAANSSDSDIEIVEPTPKGAKIQKPQPVPLNSDDEDHDRTIALALQKKWDEEDAQAKKQAAETDERSLRLIERLQEMDAKMAEKRRRLAQGKDVPDDGIVFHVVIDADGKTIEGDDDPDNAAHLDEVKRDFEQALAGGLKVKNVHWFVNAKLEARFEAAKEILNSRGIDTTEKNLFHGTAVANIQPILQNGFLIPGVSPGLAMAHGAACGIGIYLGVSSTTSFGYTQGALKMFMCRVITGRSSGQVSHAIPLPLGQDQFESWSGPGVYVSKYVELVVPRYVVEFEQYGLNPFNPVFALPALPMLPLLPMPVAPPIPVFNPFAVPVAAPAKRTKKPPGKRAVKGKGKARLVDAEVDGA
ncbi:hypothetical protein B0H11DRAFT_2078265 [Mycena galericulata]|nr:hypothetical protein B0H11DRAFT_2078265 [Mycena galericulata]